MDSDELERIISNHCQADKSFDKRFKDIGDFENQLESHKYDLANYTDHLHKIQDLVRLTADEWEERTTYFTVASDLVESDNEVIEEGEWKTSLKNTVFKKSLLKRL